jgi:hypothetical protein
MQRNVSLSKEEMQHLSEKNKHLKKDKSFMHNWLLKDDISYCEKSNCWWAVYVEGEGVYCHFCRKHAALSVKNAQTVFSQHPCIRNKTEAFRTHKGSSMHKNTVKISRSQKVSFFQKQITLVTQRENKVIEAVTRNLYFLMKEISNKQVWSQT